MQQLKQQTDTLSNAEMFKQLPTLASFEQRSIFGFPVKDVNLAAIVCLCIFGGHFLVSIRSSRLKALGSFALSLICIWLAAEGNLIRASIVFAFTFCQTIFVYLIKSFKNAKPISLVSLFTLTSLFRYWNDDWLNAQLSLILMMQLLKLVGAAYDIVDCRLLKSGINACSSSPNLLQKFASNSLSDSKPLMSFTQKLSDKIKINATSKPDDRLPAIKSPVEINSQLSEQKQKVEKVCPSSFWQLVGYVYCHCGLVLGPFYQYRIYYDWIQSDPEHYTQNQFQKQTFKIFVEKLHLLVLLFVLMVVNQQLSPMNSLVIDFNLKVLPQNFIDKLVPTKSFALILNALLAFYLYRARLYFGFLLGEFVCMAAGLGAYPIECQSKPGQGPRFHFEKGTSTKLIYIDYQAINTVDGLRAEFTGSIRTSLRHWNLPTQYWLARHVYSPLRQFPLLLRLYATLTVSAIWHGVYSGYFLSFYVLPVLFWLESPWKEYVQKVHNQTLPIFVGFWTFQILLLSYFGVPFYLLRWCESIQYWSAVGWFVKIASISAIVFLFFFN